MKLLGVGAALTALAAVAAAISDAGRAELAVRQNGIQDVINAIVANAHPGAKVPLGGDDEPSVSPAGPTPPAPTDDNEETTTAATKTTPIKASQASSTATTKTTKSTSQSAPSPTGPPCSSNGAKQCAAAGTGYQLCQGGRWIDQSCSGTDVCGKDDKGSVVCMSAAEATVKRDPCSNKNEQRCDATDQGKYQTCDGKYWQSFTCDQNSKCKMDGSKVTCVAPGNNNGAPDVPYTLRPPTAYVPVSGASPLNAALGTLAMALALHFIS
ncbi:hypothetical protein H4R19_004282 [Coemansia spiralis]|nr:hypothetical protein H4R19_004282 [Coemansia spiralis]